MMYQLSECYPVTQRGIVFLAGDIYCEPCRFTHQFYWIGEWPDDKTIVACIEHQNENESKRKCLNEKKFEIHLYNTENVKWCYAQDLLGERA